ncbi:hypothetical protein UlMin_006721 [Ulmus minor]
MHTIKLCKLVNIIRILLNVPVVTFFCSIFMFLQLRKFCDEKDLILKLGFRLLSIIYLNILYFETLDCALKRLSFLIAIPVPTLNFRYEISSYRGCKGQREFGNGRRYEDRRISDGDSKPEGRSPEQPRDLGSSSPPVVRPVREILGENTIPLRISEPPKPSVRTTDGSAQTQRTASSSSLGSTNGNPVEVKLTTAARLIDFDADPAPPVAAAAPQQQATTAQPTSQPAYSTSDSNWASFDVVPQAKVSEAPNVNSLESVLSQLSVSPPAPTHVSVAPTNAGAVTTASTQTILWTLSPAANAPGFPSNSTVQAPQPISNPAHELTSSVPSQPAAADTRSSGRQALPEDLFSLSFPMYRAPVPGWQTGPPGGLGFPMQYNTAVAMPAFQQSSKSTNPFDLSSEPPPVQAPTFPSMASFPGAQPNMMPPSGMSPSVMPPSNMLPSSMPSSGMLQSGMPPPSMPPSGLMHAYVGQHMPGNLPPAGWLRKLGTYSNRGCHSGLTYATILYL